MNVADGFDVARWLRVETETESLVKRYHDARNLPIVPVASDISLGDYLANNSDPEVIAFGQDGPFDFMASAFILSVDPMIEPWKSLRIADRELRQVARNGMLGWHRFSWWVAGERRREVDVGLMEGDPVLLGEPAKFEQGFWDWVGQAEPLPDSSGLYAPSEEAWLEVVEILIAFALAELLRLEPNDKASWTWPVDTYRVHPL